MIVLYEGKRIAAGVGVAVLGEILLVVFVVFALVRSVWAIGILVCLRVMPDVHVASLPGLNVMTLAVLTLAFAAFVRLALRKGYFPNVPLWIPMVCTYAMFWVSAFYYGDSWKAPQQQVVKDLIGMATGPIVYFYVITSDLKKKDVMNIVRWLFLVWFITAAHVLLLGIIGYLEGGGTEEFAAYVHRNDTIDDYYPATLIVALSYVLATIRVAPIELNIRRWQLSTLLLGGVAAILMSSFMSAIVGLLVALTVTLYLTRSKKTKQRASSVAVVLFVAILVSPLFIPALSVVEDKLYYRVAFEGGSVIALGPLTQRLSIWWPVAWDEFLKQPLFGLGWNRSWRLLNGPFNLVLHCLSLFGLIGTGVIVWFLMTLLRYLRQCSHYFEDKAFWSTLAIGTFAGLVGNIAFFMAEDGFFGSWFMVFYLLAALLAKGRYDFSSSAVQLGWNSRWTSS